MTEQHTHDLFEIDEGEEALLVTDDGEEVAVRVTEQKTHNDETGPHITEQRTVVCRRASDGTDLRASRIDGLSGLPDNDPFPTSTPLHIDEEAPPAEPIPEEHILGYVVAVR